MIRGEIAETAQQCGRSADDVLLVAVSKTRTPEEINVAIEAGVTDIGENKVQEIMDKYDDIKPVRWHMIGHLQTNKVKYIIDKVSMIHSVDSYKLAAEIDKRAAAAGYHDGYTAAGEFCAGGKQVRYIHGRDGGYDNEILDSCENIRIRGLMCVAPYADDPEDIEKYFDSVKEQYDQFSTIDHPNLDFRYLSMGMSHDFPVAIEAGSNLVRVGSAIFGERDYSKV